MVFDDGLSWGSIMEFLSHYGLLIMLPLSAFIEALWVKGANECDEDIMQSSQVVFQSIGVHLEFGLIQVLVLVRRSATGINIL